MEVQLTAREMFEKLGYNQLIKPNVIYYQKRVDIPKNYMIFSINFVINLKEVSIGKNLNVEELKAINKQIEELGWE